MEEIPETLTQREIAEFFSNRAPGLECPVCKKSDFSVLGKNGFVRSVRLLDDKGVETIIDGVRHGGIIDPSKLKGTVFNHVAVMRCKHCGWIALFDKAFIEAAVHSPGL